MAPFGKIYSYPNNFRVQRAQAVAAINGLELNVPEFQIGVSNKDPEFLNKFPLGKVPAFEGSDGFCLAEGAAIAEYVAASGPKAAQLLGEDAKTKSKISEWVLFTETELAAHSLPWVYVFFKFADYEKTKDKCDTAALAFQRALGKIEATVKDGRKYILGGNELTLADVTVASILHFTSSFLLDAEMRKVVPATMEYLKGIETVPEFAQAFGELKTCEVRAK
ncbi:hypothetical protein BD289DRAFT_366584 [Coniella lustricola]|uniref:Glutathione S-transferase n=1 Tax=Coniella lustricola TaxID=2025994 RepID=A0A2T3AAS4_9PEZI|nr:hypothetical protein BD289DRAFT_366584 [Coniella lustricola]